MHRPHLLSTGERNRAKRKPSTSSKRFRSSTAHKGRARVNFYLLNYIINRGGWQDLFLKYFREIFHSNSYGKLRTLKENGRKRKKMTAIMDWHGLEWYIIFCHEISWQNQGTLKNAHFMPPAGFSENRSHYINGINIHLCRFYIQISV